MKNNQIEYTMEIYERITKFIEQMTKESFGEKVSLEIFFGKKYEKFKENLIRNITLLCQSNREFLINEGYFRYIYCSRSRTSKLHDRRVTLLYETDYLKYFKDDDWSFIVNRYLDYIEFISLVIRRPDIYEKKFNTKSFLDNEVDKEFMKYFNSYIILINQTSITNYLMEKKILCFVCVYLYINKIDLNPKDVYHRINIDEVREYLVLNDVYDVFRNEIQRDNVMYEYIVDKIFNKEKRLIKGNK